MIDFVFTNASHDHIIRVHCLQTNKGFPDARLKHAFPLRKSQKVINKKIIQLCHKDWLVAKYRKDDSTDHIASCPNGEKGRTYGECNLWRKSVVCSARALD